MKFQTDLDAKHFCLEIEQFDLLETVTKDLVPTEDQMEIFLKRRREIVPKLKDFRRRQQSRQQWRRGRKKMMRGIKRFHKSTAGKRFHRALGRFLATREAMEKANEYSISINEVAGILKSLSALKTSAFIELEFYHQMSEEMEYRSFVEELIPISNRLESNLLAGDYSLSEDDEDFLVQIVKPESIIFAFEERSEFSFDEIKEKWKSCVDKQLQEDSSLSEDEINFSKLLGDLKSAVLG